MNWQELLIQARKQPGFADRKQQTCHELRNATITITKNFEEPLAQVRTLGWQFPSNEELESVFIDKQDYHKYTYTQHISRQLPRIIHQLNTEPNTRRAILYLTDEQHSQDEQHLPCLLNIWFALREQELHVTLHARSIDLLMGFPANLYQSYKLAELVSKQTQSNLASITFHINSAHVFSDYDKQLEIITTLKKG